MALEVAAAERARGGAGEVGSGLGSRERDRLDGEWLERKTRSKKSTRSKSKSGEEVNRERLAGWWSRGTTRLIRPIRRGGGVPGQVRGPRLAVFSALSSSSLSSGIRGIDYEEVNGRFRAKSPAAQRHSESPSASERDHAPSLHRKAGYRESTSRFHLRTAAALQILFGRSSRVMSQACWRPGCKGPRCRRPRRSPSCKAFSGVYRVC